MKGDETDCSYCNYPRTCKSACEGKQSISSCKRDSDLKNAPTPLYRVDTCFDIASIGKVPILRGDHNLLPQKVKDFIVEEITVLRPASVVICTGTVFEEEHIKELLAKEGRLQRLQKFENVYTAHAVAADHVTLEGRIFVDCHTEGVAKECDVIHENLGIPSVRKRARDELYSTLTNSMRGRTMFVIPYSAGPIGGRYSVNAVQLTDCPYTVLTTRMLSRVSSAVWDAIGSGDFIRCVHTWPSNCAQAFVLLNMKNKKIFSYGSAHFANAICRSSMCLRVGSVVGREMGWHAESAAIIAISDPSGEEMFACVQGSLGSGKNTLAMLQSTLPGWKVRPISSTFAWLRWHTDGKLYAMSPENGFCLQWSYRENMKDKQPIEAAAIRKRSLLLNVSENASGELHWVGRDDLPHFDEPSSPSSPSSPHFPRAKSCAVISASDIESLHPAWDSPMGVPISAYIFLTNRPTTIPVLQESPNWKDGLSLALGMRTIRGTGIDHEQLIFNPLGMSTYYPFGLNDYVKQWFDMEKESRKMPKIFHLNLFRRPSSGSSTPTLSPAASVSTSNTSIDAKSDKSSIFDRPISPTMENKVAPKDFTTVWPGFGDNIRLLAWIHGRTLGKESAVGKPFTLGTVVPASVNLEGLKDVDWETCIEYDGKGWKSETREAIKKYKSMPLYEAEHKIIVEFLETKRGNVKESLGEKKGEMSAEQSRSKEPIKEEKKEEKEEEEKEEEKKEEKKEEEKKEKKEEKEEKKEEEKKEEKREEREEKKEEKKEEPPKVEKVEEKKDEPKIEEKKEEPKIEKKEEKVEEKKEEKVEAPKVEEKKEEEHKNEGKKEEEKKDEKEDHKEDHKDDSKGGSKEDTHEERTQQDSHDKEEKKE